MRNYGQYCPIARASEILAERWTPIIIRNLLLGCATFTEIAVGAPGLSRALLAKRLRELERVGVIEITPKPDGHGSHYELTPAGRELWSVLGAMGGWAQKWMEVTSEHADPEVVLWSWCTGYLRKDRLPSARTSIRFEFPDERPGHRRRVWLLIEEGDGEICYRDPGFDEDVVVTVEDPRALSLWHLGVIEWAHALREGQIEVQGRRDLAKALPTWNGAPEVNRIARADSERVMPGRNGRLLVQAAGRGTRTDSEVPGGSGSIPGFRGAVVLPGDTGFDSARQVWNGSIDRHPSHIALCLDAGDVTAALRFARDEGRPLSVRGGGHGVAGTAVCDDGVVIDLSPMKEIHLDPTARTARAQAGVLWGEFDAATQSFGLATTGGIVSHTGISGLTLGGGIGWLMRRHGLTVDNLLEAELVTAEGESIVAHPSEHPDLFWALRGGGGNFGVVTSLKYRLHPVGPEILAGPVFWALEDAPELLAHYVEYAGDAPREVGTIVGLRKAPPLAVLPPELHGRPVCSITMAYAGDPEAGQAALAPLRRFGSPLLDLVKMRPYVDLQSLVDDTVPHGWNYYWKSANLGALQKPVIDVLIDHAADLRSPRSFILLFHLGGAVADVPEHGTAFTSRGAQHAVNISGVWLPGEPSSDEITAWARAVHADLAPYQVGSYVNFLDRDDEQRVRSTYGDHNHARLVALKQRYDPDNVFRSNHNIRPDEARCGESDGWLADDPRRDYSPIAADPGG